MKQILKMLYMFIFHPYLFWKYSIRASSRGFFVNGRRQHIKRGPMLLGENVRFGDETRINFYGNTRKKLKIGSNCYFANRNTFLVGEEIIIGDSVLIASEVCITSENHQINPLDSRAYMHQPLIIKPIKIGDGCWIGEKVIILPGVEIGEKCIIGAGSIVTKSISAFSIAVGNPAKIIKKYNFVTQKWE